MPRKPKLAALPASEFPSWLRSAIGDQSIDAFATSIGFKRQRISAVLNGREAPGSKLCEALRSHGLHEVSIVYWVKAR